MVNQLINQYRTAAKTAVEQTASQLGLPLIRPETAKAALRNMSEKDLDMLAEEYGHDQVVHWLNRVVGG